MKAFSTLLVLLVTLSAQANDDFTLMGDPDELNPGNYRAWSFAHTCDAGHGDSGSAYVDRSTGRMIGLLWTGRVPKKAEMRSSVYLEQLMNQQGPEVWTQLNYGVPAAKIAEKMRELLAQGKFAAADAQAITEWLR